MQATPDTRRPAETRSTGHPQPSPMPVGGTPVHPQETNRHQPANRSTGIDTEDLHSDVTFRHSGWNHDRQTLRAALHRCGATEDTLQRWDACGSGAWVVQDPADRTRLKLVANYCHNRHCLPCARDRANVIIANLNARMAQRKHRFLTFTVRNQQEPLADLLAKLQTGFRKLRATKRWKHHVRGGAICLEIKRSSRSDAWHPHLHVIAEGSYYPKDELQADWLRATGDSFVADIRAIPDPRQAANYVAKYVTKPIQHSLLNTPHLVDEAVTALHGRRMVTTFGNWRGWSLTETHDHTDWQPLAPLREIREAASRGDARAITIIRLLRRPDKWKRAPPATTSTRTKTRPSESRSPASNRPGVRAAANVSMVQSLLFGGPSQPADDV